MGLCLYMLLHILFTHSFPCSYKQLLSSILNSLDLDTLLVLTLIFLSFTLMHYSCIHTNSYLCPNYHTSSSLTHEVTPKHISLLHLLQTPCKSIIIFLLHLYQPCSLFISSIVCMSNCFVLSLAFYIFLPQH